MKIRAILCFLALSFPGYGAAPDAFLDQPIQKTQIEVKTYSDQLNKMREILHKPIVVPDGAENFVHEVNKGYFVTTTGFGMTLGPLTKRKFLDTLCPTLGLGWRYDPTLDTVVLDFAWRHNDPRTTQQLLDSLFHPKTAQGGEIAVQGRSYGITDPNDLWPQVFDALVSKPENFPNAWKVRFADDLRRVSLFEMPLVHLLTGKMKDETGAEHAIVVNSQPEMMNPGPVGSISYYVFDLHGNFEQGGLCSIGYRCMDASLWLEVGGKQLTLRVFNNGRFQIDEKFTLTKKGLIIGDVIDNTGTVMTGYRLTGTCYGLPLLHVPN